VRSAPRGIPFPVSGVGAASQKWNEHSTEGFGKYGHAPLRDVAVAVMPGACAPGGDRSQFSRQPAERQYVIAVFSAFGSPVLCATEIMLLQRS